MRGSARIFTGPAFAPSGSTRWKDKYHLRTGVNMVLTLRGSFLLLAIPVLLARVLSTDYFPVLYGFAPGGL